MKHALHFLLFLSAMINAGCQPPEADLATQSCKLNDIVTLGFINRVAPAPNSLYAKPADPSCSTPQCNILKHFLSAARAFPDFANGPDCGKNKLEVAAFFAHVAHESGKFTFDGQCPEDLSKVELQSLFYVNEIACADQGGAKNTSTNTPTRCGYCDPNNTTYPCSPSADIAQQYFGRGPIQLSWNYNYGAFNDYLKQQICGAEPISSDSYPPDFCNAPHYLVQHPASLADYGTLALASALWFWNTSTGTVGKTPHQIMQAQNGFGYTTQVVNGAIECNSNSPRPADISSNVQDRICNYRALGSLLGQSDSNPNLDCLNLPPLVPTSKGPTYCGTSYEEAQCAVHTCPSSQDADCAPYSSGTSVSKCFLLPGMEWCGADYGAALGNRAAGSSSACPSKQDSECKGPNEKCYGLPSLNLWCGRNYDDACGNRKRQERKTCPNAKDSDCAASEACFSLPLTGCPTGSC